MSPRIPSTRGAGRQNGIVLVMALVLLIMVSLAAIVAIRRATSGEQVSKGLRTQTVAFQAAETALRYCEDQTLKGGSGAPAPIPFSLDGGVPEQWKNRANWESAAGKAKTIDTAIANSTNSAARSLSNGVLPRCMVERLRMPSDDGTEIEAFLVTAIGYSPDYRLNADNVPETGSEVWLQSTITRAP